MENSDQKLGENVRKIELDGREIYLVGTAHVSTESVEDVRKTIEIVQPDSVCVELCPSRHKTMTDTSSWEKMNIFKVIKEKKATLLLAQLIMSSFYKRLGEKLGVKPGAEMLEAVKLADEKKAELVLADRDIQITLKRVWASLSFFNKLKMASEVMAGVFTSEKIDKELIEKIKTSDQLESVMSEFTKSMPQVKSTLIDERDVYMSQKIRSARGDKVVAVLGAGHLGGVEKNIQTAQAVDKLIEIPKPSIFPKLIKWGIPLIIIGLLIFGFITGGKAHSIESIYIWILLNGVLAALGALIALAHPLTIITSFVSAPLTSLNPMVAAGWVAGLMQAIVRKPTVADFKNLPEAVSTIKGFWTNPVIKILMVTVLANLGSSLGTFIAGAWIATRTF
jgi:pheromone shutdown-related protein TraB